MRESVTLLTGFAAPGAACDNLLITNEMMTPHHDSASCLSSMAQQRLSSMARYVQYTYQQVSILMAYPITDASALPASGRVVPPRLSPTDMSKGAAAAVGATHQPEWTLPKRYVRYSLVQKSSASRVLASHLTREC
jgi:hypothetical protein